MTAPTTLNEQLKYTNFRFLEPDETKITRADYCGYIVAKMHHAEEANRIREIYREYVLERTRAMGSFDKVLLSSGATIICAWKAPLALWAAIPVNLYAIRGFIKMGVTVADKMNELDKMRDEYVDSNGDTIDLATKNAVYDMIKNNGDTPSRYGINR